jgi:hypothetical protein
VNAAFAAGIAGRFSPRVSSIRSTARQTDIYHSWLMGQFIPGAHSPFPLAAPPGTSDHEAGFALDIDAGDSQSDIDNLASLYNFHPIPGDPGHYAHDSNSNYGPYGNQGAAIAANQRVFAAAGSRVSKLPECESP